MKKKKSKMRVTKEQRLTYTPEEFSQLHIIRDEKQKREILKRLKK